jgi:hypothetical protein
MSIKAKKEHQDRSDSALVNPSSDSFDFDLWARAVKCQMLVVLHKKTTAE